MCVRVCGRERERQISILLPHRTINLWTFGGRAAQTTAISYIAQFIYLFFYYNFYEHNIKVLLIHEEIALFRNIQADDTNEELSYKEDDI